MLLEEVRQRLHASGFRLQVNALPVLQFQLIRLRCEVINHNLTNYGYSVNCTCAHARACRRVGSGAVVMLAVLRCTISADIFDNTTTGTRSLFEATGGTTHSFLPTSALANIESTLAEVNSLRPRACDLSAEEQLELARLEDWLLSRQHGTSKSRQYFLDVEAHKEKSSEGLRWSG
jgi:hypothetical protein